MKVKKLLVLSISLAIFNISSLTIISSAIAKPAPIFRPVLNNSRDTRLPSLWPKNSKKLYLRYLGYDFSEIITFDSRPNCDFSLSCSVENIRISYTTFSFKELSRAHPTSNIITLKPGVKGVYYYEGGFHTVEWVQDRNTYSVSSKLMSRKQIIDVARSMANQPFKPAYARDESWNGL
jgi:hypothetical protein